jgi:hypothetical protein
MDGQTFGLEARREWLKTVINRAGLQTLMDDLDIVVSELSREWKEDDAGAGLYLENAQKAIRSCANTIATKC